MPVYGCGKPAAGSQAPLAAGNGIRLSVPTSVTNPPTTVWSCSGTSWTFFTPELLNFDPGNPQTGIGRSRGRFATDVCSRDDLNSSNGATLDAQFMFQFGADATLGGSIWAIASPPNIANKMGRPEYSTSNLLAEHQIVGQWSVFDFSASLWYKGRVYLRDPSLTSYEIRMRYVDDIGGTTLSIAQGTPITFAVNDILMVHVRYEINDS